MALKLTLDEVALGVAEPSTARKVVAAALERAEDGQFAAVYDALRMLVWRLLIERRLDSDLREWFNLIRQTAAAMARQGRPEATRIVALSELVSESIGFAEANHVDDLLRRAHVREVLSALRQVSSQRGGSIVPRSELQRRTGLRDANLSRILRTLIMHGLVERRPDGKRAGFELTHLGRTAVTGLPSEPASHRAQLRLDFRNPHRRTERVAQQAAEVVASLNVHRGTRTTTTTTTLAIETVGTVKMRRNRFFVVREGAKRNYSPVARSRPSILSNHDQEAAR